MRASIWEQVRNFGKEQRKLYLEETCYYQKGLKCFYQTNGQLITTIKAIEYFSIKEEILIHNCDTSYKISLNLEEIDEDYFGAIPYFFSEGENWSFLKTNGEELVSEVQEKKRISAKCSVGTYFFKEADEY